MPLDFHPADRRRAQWKALTRRARRGKNAEAFLNSNNQVIVKFFRGTEMREGQCFTIPCSKTERRRKVCAWDYLLKL